MERSAGVLLHITSLYNKYGCGSLGDEAYNFLDTIKKMGFKYWQILPFNIPDEYNCPYDSSSSVFGNPLLIDIEYLQEDGLLTKKDLEEYKEIFDEEHHELFYEKRMQLLRKAFLNVKEKDKKKHSKFVNSDEQYKNAVLFFGLLDANKGKRWQDWEVKEPVNTEFYNFLIYTFYKQWNKLKKYAEKLDVKIIGDVPIYVNLNSSDVYFNKDAFLLKDGYPEFVSGVPGDQSCEYGQKWGHPVYNIEELKRTNYKFLVDRFVFFSKMFDFIRIDHFRAFSEFYKIPKDLDPKDGHWVKGVGAPFLKALQEKLGRNTLIAEDLGGWKGGTQELLEEFSIPGMDIVEFHPNISAYKENRVAYTGTHDNNTLVGHIDSLKDKKAYLDAVGVKEGSSKDIAKETIKKLLDASSYLVILPVQDILLQDESRRMNNPGTVGDNWYYQMTKDDKKEFKGVINKVYKALEKSKRI